MPRYSYRCKECDYVLNVAHSIKERKYDCTECGTDGCLERIPSFFNIVDEAMTTSKDHKVGELVKSSIEDFRQDLKEEKKRLMTTDYEE